MHKNFNKYLPNLFETLVDTQTIQEKYLRAHDKFYENFDECDKAFIEIPSNN